MVSKYHNWLYDLPVGTKITFSGSTRSFVKINRELFRDGNDGSKTKYTNLNNIKHYWTIELPNKRPNEIEWV